MECFHELSFHFQKRFVVRKFQLNGSEHCLIEYDTICIEVRFDPLAKPGVFSHTTDGDLITKPS